MKKVILLSVGISCCIGLCACGVDKSSVIYPMQKNDNGLYYYTEDDKENVLYYYDKTAGKSQVISEKYSLFIQDNGKSDCEVLPYEMHALQSFYKMRILVYTL